MPRVRALAVVGAVLLCVRAPALAAPEVPPTNFEIRTLSNRADLISAGNALVEVRVPNTVPLFQVRLLLNGADVTAGFVTDASARTMRGVLTGLGLGRNDFVADSTGQGRGRPRAVLTITNHPIGGPVLLGSQTQPWVCATPVATPAVSNQPATNASGLSTSRSTRSATSRSNTSSSIARPRRAARARCPTRARRPRRRATPASSPTPWA